MRIEGSAQRLTIYVGEHDRWDGQPAWRAILQMLRKRGMAGATVVRGLAGFGAHSHIHTAALVRLSQDLPMRIEVIDTEERIEAVLPALSPIVKEGLMTIEPVEVIKYSHRYLQPLPDHLTVADVMSPEVETVSPATSIADVADLLFNRLFRAVPVLDEERRVVGIISDGDVLARAGIPVSAKEELSAETVHDIRDRLRTSDLTAEDIMTTPVETTLPDVSATQVAARMARSGLKRLPVVDANGHLAGMVSRIDILRAMVGKDIAPPDAPSDVETAQIAGDVMTTEVPTVHADDPLGTVADRLTAAEIRRVVVIDPSSHPIGIITDGDLIRWAETQREPGLVESVLRRLRPERDMQQRLADAGTAADLMSNVPAPLHADAPLDEILARMVNEQRKRLLVVDDDGRLLGLVDRQRLLRALLGQPN